MAEENTVRQRFVAALNVVKNPNLDLKNPHFGNKYASLKSTLGTIREACAENGIAYQQTLTKCSGEKGEYYELRSSVIGAEGVIELSTFPVSNAPNPQHFGSELTYKKRQQAQADWCIAGDEDDDGNAAAGQAKDKPRGGHNAVSTLPAPPAPKTGRFDRIGKLKARAVELGIKEEGIKSWLDATFSKPMKEFDDSEIRAVEMHISSLIKDKETLVTQEAQ